MFMIWNTNDLQVWFLQKSDLRIFTAVKQAKGLKGFTHLCPFRKGKFNLCEA